MGIFLIIILLPTLLFGSSEVRLAFDIGTGKIKMQVARVKDGQIEPLYWQAEKISLGNEPLLDQEGMITKENQDRITTILKSFKFLGESYGSMKCEAIATELFRKAFNGQDIAKNISTLLNMEIKIISPEEEGILGFLTIIQEANLDPDNVVVLDIGSGSFQITCKKGDQYLVYSAPFGRFPTHELVKNNNLLDLEIAISSIDPFITKKIQDCKNCVIGIGAHPKQILKLKSVYDKNDLKAALELNTELNLDHSDMVLAKTIMELLSIKQVNYLGSCAGNTSGIFVLQILSETAWRTENLFVK